MNIFDDIIYKEKSLHLFEVRSSKERLDALISDSFKEIGASGATFGKNEVLARLPKENGWSCEAYDFECSYISEGSILVLYKAVVKKSNLCASTASLRSSIWVNESGNWKMFFHQGTLLNKV